MASNWLDSASLVSGLSSVSYSSDAMPVLSSRALASAPLSRRLAYLPHTSPSQNPFGPSPFILEHSCRQTHYSVLTILGCSKGGVIANEKRTVVGCFTI